MIIDSRKKLNTIAYIPFFLFYFSFYLCDVIQKFVVLSTYFFIFAF